MAYDDEIIKEITGKSLEDGKEKLWKLYRTAYQIIDYKTDFVPGGFFNLQKKPIVRIRYKLTGSQIKSSDISDYYSKNRKSEEQILEENRKKLLEQQSSIQLKLQIQQGIQDLKSEMKKELSTLKNGLGEKHETIRQIEDLLSENEFTHSYIEMITERIRNYFSIDQLDDFKLVQNYVVDWIGETINVAKKRAFRPPHVIIIVGPTGIGKTSTLIKLIGRSILEAKEKNLPRPKYCIITIDNIRAGSFEQIEKMVKAIDPEVPVKQASTSSDVKEIYDDYREHVDYIFIDTAGCSPNDATHIGLMKNILDVKMNPDIYLGVTASTKASDLANILRNYEPFGYESVIVTKNDESSQLGNIISVLWDKHKTISFITDGQFVKNIRNASIVDMLLNLSGFEVDRVRVENKFGTDE